jgi:hypothetical protein
MGIRGVAHSFQQARSGPRELDEGRDVPLSGGSCDDPVALCDQRRIREFRHVGA